ncbi:restriction endonuclease subunit S [Psychrobacter sp. TAE2020]|uniref:restriction endonuclease subunit S n=1 Tax=Psychrobacter sp. TAE2020 TaxID=2846762 RepID=UPI001C0F59E3|nr:restriction endonuclease subunit S [Psychrobacter sp. TAE2020]MBU5617266.1 restriction endonuclease subunit S [Psychrobacter sp. TAE2020]
MVPSGWEVKTLEQANITVTDGDRGKEYPKSSEFFDSGYCLFLSAKNVTKNGFSFLDTQFISEEKHRKLRKGVVKKGDIVLTTRGSVGQFAYYDQTVNFENIRINSGMVTLGCLNSELESDFFYALSKSSLIARQIDSAAFGSAQPQLTVKIIKSLKLPVPPIPEQQKIAKILSTWDKAISTTEHLIDNSTQQKKALMQQLLTGKKRLLDDNGQRFEGEWEEYKLGDITDFIRDGTHGTHERYESGVPMLSAKNITKQNTVDFDDAPYISEDDYNKIHARYTIESGDILLTVVGTLGRVALVPEELAEKFTLQRSVAIIRVAKGVCNQFLMQLFSSSDFTHLLHRKSNSTAQAGVYLGELGKLKILLPSFEEQQKIATVLTNADKEIELLEQQLADLQQEKKALMQVLLTGNKRVVVDGEVD